MLRFAVDEHLGKLSRYLRLLGFDTFQKPKVGDDELLGTAGLSAFSIVLHPLVGVYSAAGLLAAAVVRFGRCKALWWFVVLPGAALIPFAALWFSEGLGKGAVYYVYFRNPHHLDPRLAMPPAACGQTLALFAVLAYAKRGLNRILPLHASIFILVTLVPAAAGLIAAKLGWTLPLVTYPFRVGPLMTAFFFCMVAVAIVEQEGSRPRLAFALALSVVGLVVMQIHQDWNVSLRAISEHEARRTAAEAIKSTTPDTALILYPPSSAAWPFLAERPTFATFKYHPVPAMGEWYTRMVSLNGHFFHSRGMYALAELERNYRRLPARELKRLRERYGLSYYLVDARRPNLSFPLVFSLGGYYLYKLCMPPRCPPT